jgi:hypothetical protein
MPFRKKLNLSSVRLFEDTVVGIYFDENDPSDATHGVAEQVNFIRAVELIKIKGLGRNSATTQSRVLTGRILVTAFVIALVDVREETNIHGVPVRVVVIGDDTTYTGQILDWKNQGELEDGYFKVGSIIIDLDTPL